MISEGRQTKNKNLYKIECEDSRGIENAWPAFLFAPTSHSILYKFLLFCLLAPDGIFRRKNFLVVGFHVEVKLSASNVTKFQVYTTIRMSVL